MKNVSLEMRFWEKVSIPEDSGCWRWIGQDHGGYGRIEVRRDGRRILVYAHRLSWEIHHSAIPDGKHVLHSCDNPSCVNPAHLFLSDQRANNADKIRKGRQAKGVQFPHSKLTPKMVSEIRRKYARKGATLKTLADEYNIAFGQIGAIVRREAWKHV